MKTFRHLTPQLKGKPRASSSRGLLCVFNHFKHYRQRKATKLRKKYSTFPFGCSTEAFCSGISTLGPSSHGRVARWQQFKLFTQQLASSCRLPGAPWRSPRDGLRCTEAVLACKTGLWALYRSRGSFSTRSCQQPLSPGSWNSRYQIFARALEIHPNTKAETCIYIQKPSFLQVDEKQSCSPCWQNPSPSLEPLISLTCREKVPNRERQISPKPDIKR